MILFRKSKRLHASRFPAPQPPFAAESFVRPYTFPHTIPIAFDWTTLRADAAERLQVEVCGAADVGNALDPVLGSQRGPVVVDATGTAETTYRSGIAAIEHLARNTTPAALLMSVDAALPAAVPDGAVVILTFWPPRLDLLGARCDEAKSNGKLHWGVVVPLVYPATFEIPLLDEVARRAARAGASFITGAPFELSPAAKRAVTADDLDEDTYSQLFHADLDALTTATERHIAALAVEHRISGQIPASDAASVNWTAATHLTHIGHRLIRLGRNELGWTILKSAAAVAQLPRPVDRIAAATPLASVRHLDEISAEILESWLRGEEADLAGEVATTWPLRRDYQG